MTDTENCPDVSGSSAASGSAAAAAGPSQPKKGRPSSKGKSIRSAVVARREVMVEVPSQESPPQPAVTVDTGLPAPSVPTPSMPTIPATVTATAGMTGQMAKVCNPNPLARGGEYGFDCGVGQSTATGLGFASVEPDFDVLGQGFRPQSLTSVNDVGTPLGINVSQALQEKIWQSTYIDISLFSPCG